MNSKKKKRSKHVNSDKKIAKNSNWWFDDENFETKSSKKVLENNDQSSESSKNINASLSDVQSEDSNTDKTADCETKHFNKNSTKVCEKSKMNSKKKKRSKHVNSDKKIAKNSNCFDDENFETKSSKKVLENNNQSSESSNNINASLSDVQSEDSNTDKTADCETKNFIKNSTKVCEKSKMNSKKKKRSKHVNSDKKIAKNSNWFDDENFETKSSKKVLENNDQSSESSKNINASLSDVQSEDSNTDKTTDCETKHFNKNSTKVCEESKMNSKKKKRSKYVNSDKKIAKNSNWFDDENFETNLLKEIDEDIFNLPDDIALAHCVAEDLRMGAGIAVDFKIRFGSVGKLIDQNLKIGDVGVINRHNQYVFYLITKKFSKGKPTMISLKMALVSLLSKMKELSLTKLGIPKIGCGLDRLDWSDVKSLIMQIFAGSGIKILVCIPSKILDRKAPPPLKVFITPKNLWEMEAQTDIIIFIDLEKINKNDWTDDIINKVDDRYPFKEKLLNDVKNNQFNSGKILVYNVNWEKIICVFFEQKTLYECIEDVFRAKYFKSKATNYLAIQSGLFNSEETFKHIVWVVLIFRSIFSYNELWLCGFTEQKESCLSFDQYCRNLWNSNSSDNVFSSPMLKDNKYYNNNTSFH